MGAAPEALPDLQGAEYAALERRGGQQLLQNDLRFGAAEVERGCADRAVENAGADFGADLAANLE